MLALLVSAVACGSGTPGGSAPAGSSQPAAPPSAVPPVAAAPAREPAPPITVKLGTVTAGWTNQLPLAVAQQLGYFRDEGLSVEAQLLPSGGPVMVAMLLNGEVDMIMTGAEGLVRGIAAGAPVMIVGCLIDKMDLVLGGAKGLTDVQDLRGKVVGTSGAGSQSEYAVVESLRRLGLEANRDYTIQRQANMAARMSALYAGQIDAVPLGLEDRVQVMADGYPILVDMGKVLPEMPNAVIGASDAFAAARPDKVAGMLRAVARATDYIRQNRDRAVELGKAHGLEGDPAVGRKVIDFAADNWRIALTRQQVATLLAERELEGTPEDFFDDRYLRLAGLVY